MSCCTSRSGAVIARVPRSCDNPRDITGSVVLVTGGSRGIGRATCERFARAGCTVIGTSRKPGAIEREGRGYELVELDVRSDESVRHCIESVVRRHKRIDILVNNAGIGQYGRLIKATREHWLAVFETNVFGVHRVTVAALPYMGADDFSRVITVGSLDGEIGYPYQALYAMSKRTLQLWNDMFDFEQRASRSPRFCLLEPAFVNTGFATSPDIVTTEHTCEDPYVRTNAATFPRFLKDLSIEPSEVADAIYTIATMKKPALRYFVGKRGPLLMGFSLEDLLAMVYTQPSEMSLAFMDAFARLTYESTTKES